MRFSALLAFVVTSAVYSTVFATPVPNEYAEVAGIHLPSDLSPRDYKPTPNPPDLPNELIRRHYALETRDDLDESSPLTAKDVTGLFRRGRESGGRSGSSHYPPASGGQYYQQPPNTQSHSSSSQRYPGQPPQQYAGKSTQHYPGQSAQSSSPQILSPLPIGMKGLPGIPMSPLPLDLIGFPSTPGPGSSNKPPSTSSRSKSSHRAPSSHQPSRQDSYRAPPVGHTSVGGAPVGPPHQPSRQNTNHAPPVRHTSFGVAPVGVFGPPQPNAVIPPAAYGQPQLAAPVQHYPGEPPQIIPPRPRPGERSELFDPSRPRNTRYSGNGRG
ncbi:hypothetical protein K474DRAFT_1712031 [Panus rudis PR-1116 ss-1]|nr:hypothetical protein K474DRAFT_1712031 [Panus rudis PR-1116 ss-1]